MELPEKKSPTERLDVQRKIEDTLSGDRPIDKLYPYISPDYKLQFTHIGTEKQLFIDNYMLDHLEDVERVFPEPERPPRPILEGGELPWEDKRYCNPIVSGPVYDAEDGKFKLWYAQSMTGNLFNLDQALCYAESTDCLNWSKPLSDACLPFGDHKATNIVGFDISGAGIVLNPDQSNPDTKFLMVYCPYERAKELGEPFMTTVAGSPDGLRWRVISEDSKRRHHHLLSIIWDESIQRWVGYSQHSPCWHIGPRTRQIARQESEDFINWSPKEVVLSGDWDPSVSPNMEFGFMSVRKIGGQYIGIVSEYPCEPLWTVREDGANQRSQVHPRFGLYCSRDGLRWHRAGESPWVGNRRPGSQDYGFADGSATGQMVHKGKTYIPYCGCPHKQWMSGHKEYPDMVPESERAKSEDHCKLLKSLGHYPNWPYEAGPLRRAIGVLILREDGWAEIRPTYEHARVVTKQFVFEGDTLKVNAECSYGCVKVEILDPHFKPYEGFSAEECDLVHCSDSEKAWHTVTWQGNREVRELWNKPCRIVFHLHEASLYGFQFSYELTGK